MKSKITKIMGVTLALVLTFTVGAAFLPANTVDKAEAANLLWSGVDIPSIINAQLVANNQNVGPVAASPNFASDNTVFAAVNDPTQLTRPTVYKSTDGGYNWVATTSNLGAITDTIVALDISPLYAADSTIFVATQDPRGGATTGRVYRSTNGNISYGQLGIVTLAANERITCMDVSPDYDGTGVIAVGVADIITNTFVADALSVQVWGLGAVLSWTSWGPQAAIATSAGLDVSAMAFSPSYPNDNSLVVVTSDTGAGAAGDMASTNPYLRVIVNGVWDQLIVPTLINATGLAAGANWLGDYSIRTARDIFAADVVVPSDYNAQVFTTIRAYVAIVSNVSGVEEGNVYVVTGVTNGVDITGSTAIQLANLDYSGTFAEGTLIGSLWDTGGAGVVADVYRTTNPTSSVVNWYGVAGAANQPTGGALATANTTAFVVMSPNYVNDTTVLVGTVGQDSAFGVSTDGAVSFNERGLIDNNGANPAQLGDVVLSPGFATNSTMFLVTDNLNAVSANDTSAWRTMDGGLHWERCFTFANTGAAGLALLTLSQEFVTDSVAYVADTGGTAVWYSADAGNSWSARNVAAGLGLAINAIVAPDATTVYVGAAASGNVAKSTNSGWTWPAAQMSNSATGIVRDLKVHDSTVLVGGNGGDVRRSDDGGTTYSLVAGSVITGGANMFVSYDAGSDTVYTASNGNAAVYRSVAGSAWTTLTVPTAATWTTMIGGANACIFADDGTLYIGDPTATTPATVGATGDGRESVFRSINPDAAQPIPGTTFEATGTAELAVGALQIGLDVAPAGSSNILVLINNNNDTLMTYTDTLSLGTPAPNLVSPADGSTLMTGVNCVFTIDSVASATNYEIWWSTTSDFSSDVNSVTWTAISGLRTPSQSLATAEGQTVYWMARVTGPSRGPFSEAWTLLTQVVTAAVSPTPMSPGETAGSTVDVAINPVLNWTAFKYASGYEMQLAKDAAMTDFIADLTGASALGNTTAYKVTDTLAYSTTYFWRVRAVIGSAATYSDWSNIVGFTTMAKPVAPTPPVIIEPTPPAPAPVEPTTPAYIWGIIAIGAVLVIVVIVLIVRTRRTP